MTLKIKEGSAKWKDAKDVRDTGNEKDLDHMQGMRQMLRAKKGIQLYGTSWVNQWNVREKGGDKLRFYPKASELYFPVFHQLSTRNHQKNVKILQQMIEISTLQSLC